MILPLRSIRLTERTQDHQQPLPQTRRDLPIVQSSNTEVLLVRQIQSNLFPRFTVNRTRYELINHHETKQKPLPEGRVVTAIVRRFMPSAGKRDVAGISVTRTRCAADEEKLRFRSGMRYPRCQGRRTLSVKSETRAGKGLTKSEEFFNA
jgi:hypothetical protein